MSKKYKCFIFSFFAILFTALLGGYFTNAQSQWYQSLTFPSFMPSPIVFGVAWTIIYIFIFISMIKQCGNKEIFYIYGINLALNALWSYVFFYMQNIAGGVVVIVFIIASLLFIIKKDKDLLLLPYLFWLIIALILNYSIYMLN